MNRRELIKAGFGLAVLGTKSLFAANIDKTSIPVFNPTYPLDTTIPKHLGHGDVLFVQFLSTKPWKMVNNSLKDYYWHGAYPLYCGSNNIVCGKIYLTPSETGHYRGCAWIDAVERPMLCKGIQDGYVTFISIEKDAAIFTTSESFSSICMKTIPDTCRIGPVRPEVARKKQKQHEN